MSEIIFVTSERQIELEILLEEEIQNLKNNTISKEEFISCIKLKKISFCDFCHLINEYIGPVKVITEPELPNLDKDIIDELIIDEVSELYTYDDTSRNTIVPRIQNVKRIKKYENIISKSKKVRQRKNNCINIKKHLY